MGSVLVVKLEYFNARQGTTIPVTFYNHAHFGDCFYSRSILQPFINRGYRNIKFKHNCSIGIFDDMSGVEELKLDTSTMPRHDNNLSNGGLNTWLGTKKYIYCNTNSSRFPDIKQGVIFENINRFAQLEHFKYYSLGVVRKDEMIPTIQYNMLNIKILNNIKNKVVNSRDRYEKLILICNGQTRSGQRPEHLNYDNFIKICAEKFPNYLFILTEFKHTIMKSDNVVFTDNIITDNNERLRPDLLYIGYLSTMCDVIMGSSSGPYCYTHTRENLLNESKTYISSCTARLEGIWYSDAKAKHVNWSPWTSGMDSSKQITSHVHTTDEQFTCGLLDIFDHHV